MKAVVYFSLLALLALSSSGCNAPVSKSKVEPSPRDVGQAVSVAFGLQPEANLEAVLDKIRNDLQPDSTPAQVTTYLDEVKKRSPVKVSISRSKRGQPIVRDVVTREMIVAYFIDNAQVFEVSMLFIFDDNDRLAKVSYTQGGWER